MFQPVTVQDLPLLESWISQPHWQEWWDKPEIEIGFIRAMVEDQDSTRPFIFHVDDKPAGYIQYWYVGDQLALGWEEHAPWLNLVSDNAVGIDLSIADADRLSRGIGRRVLNKMAKQLEYQGHESIIIDPDPENKRAVRCYQSAGFEIIEELAGKTDDWLIMQYRKLDLQ
jgi:aminoglycoside 6'-N-acetyltransferase